MQSLKLVLPNERPMSWNQLYSGKHWAVRRDEAERVHELVWATLHERFEEVPFFEGRVDIETTVYYDKYPHDPDNISDKFYIDGLCGEVIENDTREFIRKTTTRSEIDRENPRVEVFIKLAKGHVCD